MFTKRFLNVFVLLTVVLFAGSTLPVSAGGPKTSDVRLFADPFSTVPDAWSKIVRNDAGVSMTLHTSGLPAGDTFTIWWVVINNPEACSHGIPGVSLCGEGDLEPFGGDPEVVKSSALYATGHVIGDDGIGNFGGSLAVGDTSGALFGPGLLDARNAEIHLIIRSHGPMIPGLVNEQISTFGGGCDVNECADLQFSVLQP